LWSKPSKDKNQKTDNANATLEQIRNYFRSKKLFGLEIKISSIEELTEKKIKEMVLKVKSSRHVRYGNVEYAGEKNIVSVDQAENQSTHKLFPKEKAELTIDTLTLDLDDSEDEEDEETEEIQREDANKDNVETNKSKEDSKDIYSSGETESQADDVKSNNVNEFATFQNNLIELQVSS